MNSRPQERRPENLGLRHSKAGPVTAAGYGASAARECRAQNMRPTAAGWRNAREDPWYLFHTRPPLRHAAIHLPPRADDGFSHTTLLPSNIFENGALVVWRGDRPRSGFAGQVRGDFKASFTLCKESATQPTYSRNEAGLTFFFDPVDDQKGGEHMEKQTDAQSSRPWEQRHSAARSRSPFNVPWRSSRKSSAVRSRM